MSITIDRNIIEVVIEDDEIIDCIKRTFYPEDVFDYSELEKWAKENGFVEDTGDGDW